MYKYIHLADKFTCTGCSACAVTCPKRCISMQEDNEGFLQPNIDNNACIKCHKCEKVCPILNIESIEDTFGTKAYAVINIDEKIREKSSSGGVFFPLAKWVIDRGGVVFGARWNEKWEVIHDYTEIIEGIEPFMKSKYVQSSIGNTFKKAKEFLDNDRLVLFSGTSCQLGGLRAYLGKSYNNLIQIDFICHGVPSPKVWRSYLKDYFKNEKILDISFRDKQQGWQGFKCITNKATYHESVKENPFYNGFISHIFLRNSCYDCCFRHYHRIVDITLADYWGVNEVCPEMHDKKGTSIVFVHTNKGRNLLNNISLDIKIIEQSKQHAILRNPGMEYNEKKPKNRDMYLRVFRLLGFRHSLFALSKDTFIQRIKRKICKIISKI